MSLDLKKKTNKEWFEMTDIKRRWYNDSVWIPLKASNVIEKSGEIRKEGFYEEYLGLGTLAVYLDKEKDAEKLGWMEIGHRDNCKPYIDNSGEYVSSGLYLCEDGDDVVGINLVLVREGNSFENSEWLLHQDFVLAFNLKREEDVWICIDEGYCEVARIRRDKEGVQRVFEVRAEYLKDYLCARKMMLRVSSYRSRTAIIKEVGDFSEWEKKSAIEKNDTDRWEGRATVINENGDQYGSKTAVLHVSRTDVDPEVDVPEFGFPTDDVVSSKSWTKKNEGEKFYRIHGELWRNEWVQPADKSPRICNDKEEGEVFFIVNSTGKKEAGKSLTGDGRWLWFKPSVIIALIEYRGGSLSWYTKDTGSVGCSPGYNVHFGVNSLGLVNVYAKDIGLLPEWQQKIWAGFNIGPDGGVSEELLSSQMKAVPAKTKAPEDFLEDAYNTLNNVFKSKIGKSLFRGHPQKSDLLNSSHRFRVVNKKGLFILAKDLNKLIIEDIDIDVLRSAVKHPDLKKFGSIKLLENYLSTFIKSDEAHFLVGPLVGIYDMRQADAHLSGSEIDEAMELAGVNTESNLIEQGHQLLHRLVTVLYTIAEKIEKN
jgi:hypothetical protein